MNQALSVFVQQITPPFLWQAVQRARNRAAVSPWRQFGFMSTCVNAEPIRKGLFASLYDRYQPLDPFTPRETWRYRIYNVASFGRLCGSIEGDFVCAGVSWGVAPRLVFDYVDLSSTGKTLHLIDPFEGIVENDSKRTNSNYNQDPDYVLRQYPAGAKIELHREKVPLRLNRQLAFVFTDTGNPTADAAAIPLFYEELSPGGIIITEQFANNIEHYRGLSKFGIEPIWLPSGQGVIFKPFRL